MPHWKLTLSYEGSPFHGWQVQPGLRTVQGVLSDALHRITGERLLPQGSGRTDAGVHALAQVASFGTAAEVPPANLQRALNRILPPELRVTGAEKVDPSFHARHSARGKVYEYRVFERRRFVAGGTRAAERICSPFLARLVWDCRWPLDLEPMQAAADALVGRHDFTSFAAGDLERAARGDGDGRDGRPNPVKTIFSARWTREDDLLCFRVAGSGFLHHMVRNIVGTLVDVGRGSFSVEDVSRILAARDRRLAGPTAPARGLYLIAVHYEGQLLPEELASANTRFDEGTRSFSKDLTVTA